MRNSTPSADVCQYGIFQAVHEGHTLFDRRVKIIDRELSRLVLVERTPATDGIAYQYSVYCCHIPQRKVRCNIEEPTIKVCALAIHVVQGMSV